MRVIAMRVNHKSVKDPLSKKIFCLVACFLIFSKKIKKTGNQTLFYFAAGGGEILVIPQKTFMVTQH